MGDSRQQLEAMLNRAARRLTLTRGAEAAAVAAIAGALACALLEGAWTLAFDNPKAAIALCGICVLAPAVIVLAARFVLCRSLTRESRATLKRRMLSCNGQSGRLETVLAIALPMLVGVLGMAAVVSGKWPMLSKAALPMVIVPLSAVVGFVAAALRGVSRAGAALDMDQRCGLRERMVTAAQVLDGRSPAVVDEQFAQALCKQALASARQARVDRRWFWTRGRPTLGALGLSVLLCVAVAALPSRGPADVADGLAQLGGQFPELTAQQKDEVVRKLRQAMEQAKDSPDTGDLRTAVVAAQENDPKLFSQAMAELAQRIRSGDLKFARSMEKVGGVEKVQDAPVGAGAGEASQDAAGDAIAASTAQDLAQSVYVQTSSVSSPTPLDKGAQRPSGAYMPFDQAWEKARIRAGDSISRGNVPPQYRQLVRDYFLN